MEFQVLGQVAALRDREVVRPAGRLERTLLSVLLARCDTPVPVEVLTEALWPDGGRQRATPKLHVLVSRLRSVLGDRDRLRSEQNAYRLRVLPDELDAERFLTMVDEAGEEGPVRRVQLTRKALTLWRGEPYGGIDVPMVAEHAVRLRERRLHALDVLYRAELSLGRHVEVLAELAEFAAAHPLHEPAQWLFIAALYRSGRRAEALAAYRVTRGHLMDELTVEPGPALRELERRMVAGEPDEARLCRAGRTHAGPLTAFS